MMNVRLISCFALVCLFSTTSLFNYGATAETTSEVTMTERTTDAPERQVEAPENKTSKSSGWPWRLRLRFPTYSKSSSKSASEEEIIDEQENEEAITENEIIVEETVMKQVSEGEITEAQENEEEFIEQQENEAEIIEEEYKVLASQETSNEEISQEESSDGQRRPRRFYREGIQRKYNDERGSQMEPTDEQSGQWESFEDPELADDEWRSQDESFDGEFKPREFSPAEIPERAVAAEKPQKAPIEIRLFQRGYVGEPASQDQMTEKEESQDMFVNGKEKFLDEREGERQEPPPRPRRNNRGRGLFRGRRRKGNRNVVARDDETRRGAAVDDNEKWYDSDRMQKESVRPLPPLPGPLGGRRKQIRFAPEELKSESALDKSQYKTWAGAYENQYSSSQPQPGNSCIAVLNTRIGDGTNTVIALLKHVNDPHILQPIFEDIAVNYMKNFGFNLYEHNLVRNL